MKRLISTLFMLIIVAGAALCQTDHGYNIYGNFFGPSTGIGICLDSRFKTGGILGYSAGIGYTDFKYKEDDFWIYRFREIKSKGLSIPLEVNAIMGNRASKFEVGLGMTVYLVDRNEIVFNNTYDPPVTKDGTRTNIAGIINVGYRLQRKSGFFMKLGLTAIIGNFSCSPLDGWGYIPNLCFGYTIKHF